MEMSAYYRELPTEIPQKMAQAFLGTALLSAFFGTAPHLAIVGGSIAALATLVEAVSRPVIRQVFVGHDTIIRWSAIVFLGGATAGWRNACQELLGITYNASYFFFSCVACFVLNFSEARHPVDANRAICQIFA